MPLPRRGGHEGVPNRVPARSPHGTVPLGQVDPVTMSEAVNDLVRSAS